MLALSKCPEFDTKKNKLVEIDQFGEENELFCEKTSCIRIIYNKKTPAIAGVL